MTRLAMGGFHNDEPVYAMTGVWEIGDWFALGPYTGDSLPFHERWVQELEADFARDDRWYRIEQTSGEIVRIFRNGWGNVSIMFKGSDREWGMLDAEYLNCAKRL